MRIGALIGRSGMLQNLSSTSSSVLSQLEAAHLAMLRRMVVTLALLAATAEQAAAEQLEPRGGCSPVNDSTEPQPAGDVCLLQVQQAHKAVKVHKTCLGSN